MSILASLWHVLVAVYRAIVALSNAWIVLRQVVQSIIQESKQEANELMALLDDGGSTTDVVTSGSLVRDADTSDPENAWQMLIIARASSFVLLVRISKHRVLHLEVDETFILGKLEVIRTEMTLRIAHISRLLKMPIGMHDTRLVRYTPTKLPYLWKETTYKGANADKSESESVVPAASAPVMPSSVSASSFASASGRGEGRANRKKCVQLLTESTVRRRMRMGLEGTPKKENMTKRRALANATNGVAESVSKERVHGVMSENSIRKGGSLRRKKRFDLYALGVGSEFSLLAKTAE